MKKVFSVILLSFFTLFLFAQNEAPEVLITEIVMDKETNTLTIHYDLNDKENDYATVVLQQSINSGDFLNIEENVTGDIGADIKPGIAKSIYYTYPEELDFSSIEMRILAYDAYVPSIAEMTSQVSIDSLKNNMDSIIGIRHHISNPEHKEQIIQYLSSYQTKHGLKNLHQEFEYGSIHAQNLIGSKQGLNNLNLCIANAHYDTVSDAPGADDNGSGVISIMEILRIMSNYSFENQVLFTFFDLEELGLIGARHFINNFEEGDAQITALLNYDMIGYYSDEPNSQTLPAGAEILFPDLVSEVAENGYRGDFIFGIGADGSYELLETFVSVSEEYAPDLKIGAVPAPGNGGIIPDMRRSDHAPFWDKGYPAIFMTDGAETRNPFYHSPDDVIETLDFDFIAKVTKGALATLATVAKPINASYTALDLSGFTTSIKAAETIDLKLWPNPSTDRIYFSYNLDNLKGNPEIRVIDARGLTIYTQQASTTELRNMHVNIEDLTPGQYYLQIHDKMNIYSIPFLKS